MNSGDVFCSMRTKAIELGYAEHDSKTGEWRWVKPESQEVAP